MKTPEEIKKGLECCIAGECKSVRRTCPYRKEGDCVTAIINEALTYIQQLEAQVPKWIGVREADPHAECLAVGKYGDMLIGCVYPRGNEYWCENEHEVLYNVTHWMPLPEPPKER